MGELSDLNTWPLLTRQTNELIMLLSALGNISETSKPGRHPYVNDASSCHLGLRWTFAWLRLGQRVEQTERARVLENRATPPARRFIRLSGFLEALNNNERLKSMERPWATSNLTLDMWLRLVQISTGQRTSLLARTRGVRKKLNDPGPFEETRRW